LLLLVKVTLLYTITNVGILCLLSGFLGVAGNRYLAEGDHSVANSETVARRYFSAMIGAFLLYLIITSGAFTLLDVSFKPPEVDSDKANITAAQDHYKTLATFSSIVCLLEGYSPFAMNAILRRLKAMIRPPPPAAGS
jgi:hypothetical protein